MDKMKRHLAGSVGHILLLASFAAYAIWYALDAFAAQSKIQNMLLIAPASAIVLGLVVLIAIAEIRRITARAKVVAPSKPEVKPEAEPKLGQNFQQRYGTIGACISMAVYVILMPFIGFDVATVLFIAVSMVMQGARNWLVIAAFSLTVGLLPVWALEYVLSIPVPTLVL